MTQQNNNPLSLFSNQLADLIEAAAGAVVGVGGASGVIVDAEAGLVATSAHRLRRGRRSRSTLSVQLPDGTEAPATLRGVDRGLDLALLHVEGLPETTLQWSDAAPRTGHLAVTIGREDGQVRATLGMISAVRGAWRSPGGVTVPRWTDVDAALPPSSAGGLLLDASGAAIGWNTPVLSQRGAVLPPETIRAAVDRLKDGSSNATRGYLGVGVQLVRLDADTIGLLVNSVEADSPAVTAGIAVGDVLLSLDGAPLDDAGALLGALRGRVGEAVTLTRSRGGVVGTVTATPAERPARRRCG
jgi:S1-C subfamily serine protease